MGPPTPTRPPHAELDAALVPEDVAASLREFAASLERVGAVTCPPLPPAARHAIHVFCEENSLASASEGAGEARHVVVRDGERFDGLAFSRATRLALDVEQRCAKA